MTVERKYYADKKSIEQKQLPWNASAAAVVQSNKLF
jgi:hypothetical protein